MTVEIWSDVVCPFCYIGKRQFEKALAGFPNRDEIQVEWKSFQLSPEQVTDPSMNIHQALAAHKGVSVEEAQDMNDYVTKMAASAGLDYHFEKAIPANTFKAHRFLHLAKAQGKQQIAKERIMHAYFTEGKNIDNDQLLLALAREIGLESEMASTVLTTEAYATEVRADIAEAFQLGIRAVPCFVFDRKYGVSGAQEASVFSEVLTKSFAEWKGAQAEAGDKV